MCIEYRGTLYHYGILVEIPSSTHPKRINILMTNHKENRPYIYSAICLDNGLQVNTDIRERYAALHDIIGKIVSGTILAERTFSERYPDLQYRPFNNILEDNPKLSKNFNRRMAKALPLEKYKVLRAKLTPLWEKPKYNPEEASEYSLKSAISLHKRKILAIGVFMSILFHSVSILYDCKDMILAFNKIQNDPQLNNSKINYRRV